MRFEWDDNKQRSNIQKHSVSFTEACLIFSDRFILTRYDTEHSHNEDRWISLGLEPVRQLYSENNVNPKV